MRPYLDQPDEESAGGPDGTRAAHDLLIDSARADK
jgi:hypothetical protein